MPRAVRLHGNRSAAWAVTNSWVASACRPEVRQTRRRPREASLDVDQQAPHPDCE